MRRGDEVDVVRALLLQLEHDLDQAPRRDLDAEPARRDLVVLAVTAFKRAGREEHRAGTALPRNGRLLPKMQGGARDLERCIGPANTARARRAVCPATTGAQLAMGKTGRTEQLGHA